MSYSYTIDILDWVDDQIEDECFSELNSTQRESLAHHLYQNFDFSSVYDQFDHLTTQYLNSVATS